MTDSTFNDKDVAIYQQIIDKHRQDAQLDSLAHELHLHKQVHTNDIIRLENRIKMLEHQEHLCYRFMYKLDMERIESIQPEVPLPSFETWLSGGQKHMYTRS